MVKSAFLSLALVVLARPANVRAETLGLAWPTEVIKSYQASKTFAAVVKCGPHELAEACQLRQDLAKDYVWKRLPRATVVDPSTITLALDKHLIRLQRKGPRSYQFNGKSIELTDAMTPATLHSKLMAALPKAKSASNPLLPRAEAATDPFTWTALSLTAQFLILRTQSVESCNAVIDVAKFCTKVLDHARTATKREQQQRPAPTDLQGQAKEAIAQHEKLPEAIERLAQGRAKVQELRLKNFEKFDPNKCSANNDEGQPRTAHQWLDECDDMLEIVIDAQKEHAKSWQQQRDAMKSILAPETETKAQPTKPDGASTAN